MGSGIVVIKQYSSCQLAWMFSANCIRTLRQNFSVQLRIHIFTTLLKTGREYSLRIPKSGKHNLTSWWSKINFSVEGQMGCFYCFEARFDSPLLIILLSISSHSSAFHKRYCKDRPIRFIFSRSLSFLDIQRSYTFRNFKRSRIMLYAQLREHSNAVTELSIVILPQWIRGFEEQRAMTARRRITIATPRSATSFTNLYNGYQREGSDSECKSQCRAT
jgi:hypothetical protein